MVAKRNVLKSQLPLIIVAATILLVTLMWFVYRSLGRSRCDSIFEQTADSVHAEMQLIEGVKGKLTLGQQRVQELTDSSQKVSAHLKTCCIFQQARALNAEQLQVCMSGAKDYHTQIIQVANNIKEADAARKQQKPELAKQKTDAAKEAASKVVNTEKTLAKALPPPPVKDGAEQEPNNTIPQANAAEIDTSIAGEVSPADDEDYFKFHQDAKERRDIVDVLLNPSTTLQPKLASFKEDRSTDQNWAAPNRPGAELKVTFPAEPGKIYYVGVASYNGSTGAYTLSVVPRKAYDQYEPNDNAFTKPTPVNVGQTIEANIMDGTDVDSYRISGVKEKNLTIDLRPLSPGTLQPRVRVRKSDMSIARDWNAPNAAGAQLKFSIASEPGQEYFVEVASYNKTDGPYELTVR